MLTLNSGLEKVVVYEIFGIVIGSVRSSRSGTLCSSVCPSLQ